ncbi:MAG: outer membrane protein assembly factor BamE [Thermodesulfobacteriota bacterium]
MIRGVKRGVFLVLIAAVFAVTGCAFTGGKKLDTLLVQKIVHGKTTKKEILEMFGEPEHTTADEKNNETWAYAYVETKVKAAKFLPIVGMLAGPNEQETQTLAVVFNSKGVVIDHRYQKNKGKSN